MYIFCIKFNFRFYYFARTQKLRAFILNRVEIKALCLSVFFLHANLSAYLF